MDDIEAALWQRKFRQEVVTRKIEDSRPGQSSHLVPFHLGQIGLLDAAGKEMDLVFNGNPLGKLGERASASVAAIAVNHGVGDAESVHDKIFGRETLLKRGFRFEGPLNAID
jgi:hypothetical protein